MSRVPFATTILLAVVLIASVSAASASVPGGRAESPTTGTVTPRATSIGSSSDREAPPAGPITPSAAEGSVISSIELVANRTYPNAWQPTAQYTPSMVVFDPVNGLLYVRGQLGEALTIINTSTNQVIQELTAPASQNEYSLADTMAVDTTNGDVYLANQGEQNVSIVDGTTNEIIGSITTGGAPNGITFDPTNGCFYVAKWSNDTVGVINATTNRLVAEVPVGNDPGPILYDLASEEVFTADMGVAPGDIYNVSVIGANSNTLKGTVRVGPEPIALALDTSDNLVDVANGESDPGFVTVIPAGDLGASYNVSVGVFPDALAYSSARDQLAVANGGSANVTIISQSDHRVVANISTGDAPEAAAYEPFNEEVYVLNSESYNVSILDMETDQEIAQVTIDNSYDYGIVLDTATGDIYVVSEGSDSETGYGPAPFNEANATAINPISHVVDASIPLDLLPYSLTYDAYDGELVIPDVAGNATYFVNASTDEIVGITPVATYPMWAAVDPSTGEVAVVDYLGSPLVGVVTFLNAAHRVVSSTPTGYDPTGIAFDAANGDFYVPDDYGGNVTVLSAATRSVVTVVAAAASSALVSVAYDPGNSEVYVGDETNSTVGVIDSSTNAFVKWIHVGSDPISFAFDSENGTVFVANEGSENLSVIDQATNSLVLTEDLADAEFVVYDSANGLVYNAESYAGDVDTINATTYAVDPTPIYLGSTLYPHAAVYDPANGRVYVTTEYSGIVSVIGATGGSYSVTFEETGLPQGTTWSIDLNGTLLSSIGPAIATSVPNATYPFTVEPVVGFASNVSGGNVVVDGKPVTIWIAFSAQSFSVTFVETGLPAATYWTVTLSGTLNGSSTSDVGFVEPNGSIDPYTIGVVSGYVSNVTSGSVTVDGAAIVVDVGFTYSPTHLAYSVTFDESGLSSGTSWSIDLNGSENSSTTGSMQFEELNGTYAYSVGVVTGYTANATGGSVHVAGLPITRGVVFTASAPAANFSVTFTESGLPGGTTWGVAVDGAPATTGSTSSITFPEPNGSYNYVVQNVSGYRVVPDSGGFTVSGGPASVSVTYTSSNSTSTSSSGPSWDLIVGILAVVIILVMVGFFAVAFGRRRRARGGKADDPNSPSGAPTRPPMSGEDGSQPKLPPSAGPPPEG